METRFFRKLSAKEWGEYWRYKAKRYNEMGSDEGVFPGRQGLKVWPKAEQKVWEEFIQILEKRDELKKVKGERVKPRAKSSWD